MTEWSLPYTPEPGDSTTLDLSTSIVAGEVTVMAASLDVPAQVDPAGVSPILVLRLGVDPYTGRTTPPVVLILGPGLLASLPQLVADAVKGALDSYRSRGGGPPA